jgi:hypothetical protein
MPLQNRVHPTGAIHATGERGTMLGNRGGRFHRDDKTLGKRRWATHHWICCELHYKGMHHEPMGKGYTSLFFLDEVTALAAGHRPCFFCRRKEAREFVQLSGKSTDELDRLLHAERTTQGNGERELASLPSGAMVEIDGEPCAIKDGSLLRWSFSGYAPAQTSPLHAKLLTPPTIIAILAKGFKPRWHPSAFTWGTS